MMDGLCGGQKSNTVRCRYIIIYGWNEYFEATCIEPTLEYGDFYLNLTQKLIEKVRSGEGVDIVPGEIISQKYQPIYLTEQLKAVQNVMMIKFHGGSRMNMLRIWQY